MSAADRLTVAAWRSGAQGRGGTTVTVTQVAGYGWEVDVDQHGTTVTTTRLPHPRFSREAVVEAAEKEMGRLAPGGRYTRLRATGPLRAPDVT